MEVLSLGECPICFNMFPEGPPMEQHVTVCFEEQQARNAGHSSTPIAASAAAPQQSASVQGIIPTSPRGGESSNTPGPVDEDEDLRLALQLQNEENDRANPGRNPQVSQDEKYARELQRRTSPRRQNNAPPSSIVPVTFGVGFPGGGILRLLRMRGDDPDVKTTGSPTAAKDRNIPDEYKRLQKAILDGALPCSKQEATELASYSLAVKMTKLKPEDRLKRRKLIMAEYYPTYRLKSKAGKSRDEELQERTWKQYESLCETINVSDMSEVPLMAQYVGICKRLEYYGMTLYTNVVECIPTQKEKPEKSIFDRAFDSLDDMLMSKKQKEEKERDEKRREWERQNYIYYQESNPVIVGLTNNCSVVRMNAKTKKVEKAWKEKQIRYYNVSKGSYLTLELGEMSSPWVLKTGSAETIFMRIDSYRCSLTAHEEKQERQMRERIRSFGLRLREVAGDGNCQMRAIADQLWGAQDRHVAVRNSVVRWLRENPNYPIKDDSGRVIAKLSDYLESDYHSTWEEYCDYMSKSANWGDHLTLIAAAEVYNRVLWVLSSVQDSSDSGFNDNPWTTIEPHDHLARKDKELELEQQAILRQHELAKEEALLEVPIQELQLVDGRLTPRENVHSEQDWDKGKGKEKEYDKGKGKEREGRDEKEKENEKEKEDSERNKDDDEWEDVQSVLGEGEGAPVSNISAITGAENKNILLCHWHERHYGSLASIEARSTAPRTETKRGKSKGRSRQHYYQYKDRAYT